MKKFRKLTAGILTGVLAVAFLAGCGAGGEINGDAAGNGKEGGGTGTADSEKSMGRYLEEELAAPEVSGTPHYQPDFFLQQSDDGMIVLVEKSAGTYCSEDKGESWEKREDFWSGMLADYYIGDLALSPDGAAAVIGSPYEEESESAGEFLMRYYYISPDGVMTEIPFPGNLEEFLTGVDFDRQGRLYGYGIDGRVYRFDTESGAAKELFSVEGTVESACFTDRYMMALTSRKAAVIYDLEQEITVEDGAVQNFIRENAGQPADVSNDSYSVIAAAGEQEDIIYLAVSGGLYRHVIGGAVMEQVIDGAMTTFGDPSVGLMDMMMLPDNEFIVVYSGGKLCRYTYNPDVPTVPERQLTVYSLAENYSLRQAVSLFQKTHPDVYVHYEIGLSGEEGMTRDDAVRNLNTKIMAGEGPDIMLLDGLPKASYEEKGVLADLSTVVESMDGEEALFPNVVDACRRDGKIYALPIRIQIPFMAGRKEDVERITDLDSLADAMEDLREKNPEGVLLGLKSPEQLLQVLSLTSSAAWTDDEGRIDEEALGAFLTAAERIWQAELSGASEEWLESEANYSARFSGEGMYYGTASNQALNILVEGQQFGVGKLYRVDFDYDTITSIAGIEEDFVYAVWNGQVENGFIPDGMAGVLANAAEDELVMEFYRFLFGRELQDMDLSGGFPVNMASFDGFEANPYEDPDSWYWENFAGGMHVVSDDGERFALELMWPSEEEFGELREMVSGMSVVNMGDAMIEEVVFAVGKQVLNGDMSVEAAVEEVVKRAAIYLAE